MQEPDSGHKKPPEGGHCVWRVVDVLCLWGSLPERRLLMERFLWDVLAAFVAGVLVAVVVERWINRR